MSQAKVLDLDKFVPDKRVVRLAGQEIDVSVIPSVVTLEIAEKDAIIKSQSSESFAIMMNLVTKIMQVKNKDITSEWVAENTSMDQLMQLLEFVMEPLREKAAKASNTGKNT